MPLDRPPGLPARWRRDRWPLVTGRPQFEAFPLGPLGRSRPRQVVAQPPSERWCALARGRRRVGRGAVELLRDRQIPRAEAGGETPASAPDRYRWPPGGESPHRARLVARESRWALALKARFAPKRATRPSKVRRDGAVA